jgi:hypothetical protein
MPLTPESPSDRAAAVFPVFVFYRTPRAGQVRLSDGGGPFGFDIGKALIVDYLLAAYGCDAVAETGCFLGDTTWFLGSCYPDLPVVACDFDPQAAFFTTSQTASLANVGVSCRDAVELVEQVTGAFARPLLYLDAHWGQRWPLHEELASARQGVVVIDDFDIGHPRFGFDVYDDLVCGPDLLARLPDPPPEFWVNDPDAVSPPVSADRPASSAPWPPGTDSAAQPPGASSPAPKPPERSPAASSPPASNRTGPSSSPPC